MRKWRFFAGILVLASLWGCGDHQSVEPSSVRPLEIVLASIDAGTLVAGDDITVPRFRFLLEQLDDKFGENEREISDVTVEAQGILLNKGIKESLLNIMEGINSLMFKRIENREYVEYVAAYVTVREQAQSHSEAMIELRRQIESLVR